MSTYTCLSIVIFFVVVVDEISFVFSVECLLCICIIDDLISLFNKSKLYMSFRILWQPIRLEIQMSSVQA